MKSKPLAVLMAGALCLILSSCKPKPISGQVFVVTQAGLNIPLGAVEIEVVKQKDADDFMKRRQIEIENKLRPLQKACDVAKTNCDAAVQVWNQAQAVLNQNSASYTNDTQYASLWNEREKDTQTIATLTKAIDYLRPQAFPANPSGNIFAPRSPAAQQTSREAVIAMDADAKKCNALRARVYEIEHQCDSIKEKTVAPFMDAVADAYSTVVRAQGELNVAKTELARFPNAKDYMGDFRLAAIEKTVTDANGDFIIQNPVKGAIVFPRAQRQTLDSVENYFWLVDLPAKVEKLVLSNNNMFSVPNKSLP